MESNAQSIRPACRVCGETLGRDRFECSQRDDGCPFTFEQRQAATLRAVLPFLGIGAALGLGGLILIPVVALSDADVSAWVWVLLAVLVLVGGGLIAFGLQKSRQQQWVMRDDESGQLWQAHTTPGGKQVYESWVTESRPLEIDIAAPGSALPYSLIATKINWQARAGGPRSFRLGPLSFNIGDDDVTGAGVLMCTVLALAADGVLALYEIERDEESSGGLFGGSSETKEEQRYIVRLTGEDITGGHMETEIIKILRRWSENAYAEAARHPEGLPLVMLTKKLYPDRSTSSSGPRNNRRAGNRQLAGSLGAAGNIGGVRMGSRQRRGQAAHERMLERLQRDAFRHDISGEEIAALEAVAEAYSEQHPEFVQFYMQHIRQHLREAIRQAQRAADRAEQNRARSREN